MYRYWEAKWLVVLVVAILVMFDVIEAVSGKSRGSFVSTIAWAYLAIVVHNAILNKTSFSGMRRGILWPFLWRSLVLSLPGILLAVLAVIYSGIPRESAITRLLLIAIVYSVAESFVFAAMGTWLPAAVAERGNRAITAALRRGRLTFFYVLMRLYAGCGLFMLSAVTILIAIQILVNRLNIHFGLEQHVGSSEFALGAIGYLCVAFNFVMLPVILSRAYLIAEADSPSPPAYVATNFADQHSVRTERGTPESGGHYGGF